MSYRPYRFGKALWYAFLLWIVGFIWGIIVFTVPALKNVPSVPYISKFPAVSATLTVAYLPMMFYLGKSYLKETDRKAEESLKFGLAILLENLVLDILVYVFLFGSTDYFAYLSIWISYMLFLAIPLLIGRRQAK